MTRRGARGLGDGHRGGDGEVDERRPVRTRRRRPRAGQVVGDRTRRPRPARRRRRRPAGTTWRGGSSSAGRPMRHSRARRRSRYSTHDDAAAPRASPTTPRRGGPSSSRRRRRAAARTRGRRCVSNARADDGPAVEREHEEGAEPSGQAPPAGRRSGRRAGHGRGRRARSGGAGTAWCRAVRGRRRRPRTRRGGCPPALNESALEQRADDHVARGDVQGDGQRHVEGDAVEADRRAVA